MKENEKEGVLTCLSIPFLLLCMCWRLLVVKVHTGNILLNLIRDACQLSVVWLVSLSGPVYTSYFIFIMLITDHRLSPLSIMATD